MVFNIFKTVCYEDVVDDDETLSSGCLTSNLRKKHLKFSNLYNFFGETAKVDAF